NTLYTYRVRAVNGAGVSGYSNEATGSTLSIAITFLTVSPDALTGGQAALGMVTLTGPAPAGGALVFVWSDSPSVVTLPANVTVPPGATWATFPVGTRAVTAATSASITAGYAGGTQTAVLALVPADAAGTARIGLSQAGRAQNIAVFRPSTR